MSGPAERSRSPPLAISEAPPPVHPGPPSRPHRPLGRAGGREVEHSLPPAHTRLALPLRDLRFPSAAQPEIIRANQKDLFYLAELYEQIETVARGIMGTRWLQNWAEELQQASRLAYFSLTTLLGSQTLGEEYCDIMQYDGRAGNIPHPNKRAAVVAAHVLMPYLIGKLYSVFRRRMISLRDSAPEDSNDGWHRKFTARLARVPWPVFSSLVDDHLRTVHLTIFYLAGRYYHLAKRLFGIRYISSQTRRPGTGAGPPSYEVLGVLMGLQLVIRICRAGLERRRRLREEKISTKEGGPDPVAPVPEKVRPVSTVDGRPISSLAFDPDNPTPTPESALPKYVNFRFEHLSASSGVAVDDEDGVDGEAQEADSEQAEAHSRRCTLCLGPRRDPTGTECGHVFCWECVVGWAREKSECPLCRQAISLPGLVPLYNL